LLFGKFVSNIYGMTGRNGDVALKSNAGSVAETEKAALHSGRPAAYPFLLNHQAAVFHGQ
jgi:hypothetical protein